MVVVIAAAHNGNADSSMKAFVSDYVVTAAAANGPLPSNPTAQADLRNEVAGLANPVQAVPVQPTTAGQISGKRYQFPENDMGWTSLQLDFQPGAAAAQAATETESGTDQASIGLDNVYRVSSQLSGGQIAVRGSWIDDHTFVAHELLMGDIHEFDVRLEFSGNSVTVHVAETVFGDLSADFTGTAP